MVTAAAASGQGERKTRCLSASLKGVTVDPRGVGSSQEAPRGAKRSPKTQSASGGPDKDVPFLLKPTSPTPPQGSFVLLSTCSRVLQRVIWSAAAAHLAQWEKPWREVSMRMSVCKSSLFCQDNVGVSEAMLLGLVFYNFCDPHYSRDCAPDPHR